MKRSVMILMVCLLAVPSAYAQTLDGHLNGDEAFYGAALSTQNTKTQFGDALNGDPVNGGGGSEIDQVYAKVANGRLNVFVSGNLEANFNKIEVFLDTKAGGVNSLDGSTLPTGADAFCCGGIGTSSGALQRMSGLKFDADFNADYYLTFTNGFETVNPNMPDSSRFWAASAHYANLAGGPNAVVSAGMQLAYDGLPNVLRFPGDYNRNGTVDTADYVVWRKMQGQTVPRGSGADADGSTMVDAADYGIWANRFGDNTSLAGFPFVPENLASGVSEALLGPALPVPLSQGQLIDRNYAIGAGGCNADDTGAGCVARELEFALNVDPSEIGTNQSSHRNFNNTIDLKMAFDNSNKIGVRGSGGPWDLTAEDDPQNVKTGLEFSIPLAQIGASAVSGPIKMTVFVNGGGHDYISNQFGGMGVVNYGGPGTGANIATAFFGMPPAGSFLDLPGDQFVTVPNPGSGGGSGQVPEPASIVMMLLGLGASSSLVRRRR